MYSGVLLTKGRRQDFGLIWQHCTELCFLDVHGETSNLKNHWTVNSMSDDSTHLKSFNSPALTDLAVNNSYVPTSNKCDTQCIIHCSLCIQRFASCTLHHFTSQTEDPVQNNTHLHFTDSPDIYPSATQTGASLCTSQPEEQVNPLLCRSQHHHPHSSSAPSVDRKTLVHPLLKNYRAPSVENSCVPSTEEPNRNLQCSVSIEKVQRVYRKGTHNTSGFSSREISAVFVWAPRLPTRALFLLFFL